ncbi:MAG: S8 family peptidase [Bacteroidota bacterium]|nr:S8 family peptidase [Bacteroidota bacterium]
MKFFSKCFILFSFFLASLLSYSQQKQKISLSLNQCIEEKKNSSEALVLIIKGEVKTIKAEVIAAGGKIKYSYNDIFAINIPVSQIRSFVLNTSDAIEHIEFHYGNGIPLDDQMLINNKVDLVHDGLVDGIPEGLTGKGVLIGIIDTGIDFNHPDFQDSTGKTRVKYIWDQNYPYNSFRTPQPYNYGQEWSSSDIDQGICPHDDQPAFYGHGSNVTGTAAGNGLAIGKYKGVAPEADLIIVSSKFGSANWLGTVVDAAHYIFSKADSLGMPCVINASVGTYSGSHDAKDLAAQLISTMTTEKSGRAFVCAAGNRGESVFHLGYNITSTPKFTWFAPQSNGTVRFHLWTDTVNFNNAEFAFGADKVLPYYDFRGSTPFFNINNRLNIIKSDSLFSIDGNLLGIVQTWCEQIDSRYLMQVEITKTDSSNYYYRFITKGSGRFDTWSADWLGYSNMIYTNLPTPAVFPEISNYVSPDNKQSIVSSFSCSADVLTVGNYTNRNSFTAYYGNTVNINVTVGEISSSSSLGPARTGLIKPDVAATGNIIICPGRLATLNQFIISDPNKVVEGGKHTIGGGTSMASPVVAGIAALYFQLCPNAHADDIKKAIIETAFSDEYTGATPNLVFGYGKISASGVVSKGVIRSNISTSNTSILCEGDTLVLSSNKNFHSYLWNTGDTLKSLNVVSIGEYQLSVYDKRKCKSTSAPYNVGFAKNPSTPLIWREENILYTAAANKYQWYLNGEKIIGANSLNYNAVQDGDYSVEITNSNECSAFSNIFPFVLFTGENFKANIYPVPTSGPIEIDILNNIGESTKINVINVLGQIVLSELIVNSNYNFKILVDLSGYDKGIYFIQLINKENIYSSKIVKGS